MAGLFICLEGIDGTGKHTQTELLERKLKGMGYKVAVYSYPDYNSRYGRIIKHYLDKKIELDVREFFFLQMMDKQKDREKLLADLKAGKIVIADRYVESQIAYQSAGGFDYNDAKSITKLSGLPDADLMIYLDVGAEDAYDRKGRQKKGKRDRLEDAKDYLNKVRQVYDKLYEEGYGARRWVKIDTQRNIEEVHKKIFAEVSALLK